MEKETDTTYINETANLKGQHVTIRDIARIASVSPTTVSLILNKKNASRFSQKTRKKVIDVCEAVKYRNSLLSRLIKEPLRHLGILVTDPAEAESTYFLEILKGIRQVCMENNYLPVLCPSQSRCQPNISEQLIELVASKQIDGWIIDKQDMLSVEVVKLLQADIALVLVNTWALSNWEPDSAKKLSWVVINNRRGSRVAIEHLIRIGHRTIAFLTRPYESLGEQTKRGVDTELITEYQSVLKEKGMPFRPELVQEASLVEPEVVDRAVGKIMSIESPPTAIFAADDYLAMMAINSLRTRGYRVPDDVSMVGYGDLPIVRLSSPPLTTVHCPLEKMGRLAATYLIRRISDNKDFGARKVLEPELVIRGSCRPTSLTLQKR